MDKKNTIIGVLLLLASFYFMHDYSSKEAELAKHKQTQAVANTSVSKPTKPAIAIDATEYKDNVPEATEILENKDIDSSLFKFENNIKKVDFSLLFVCYFFVKISSMIPYSFASSANIYLSRSVSNLICSTGLPVFSERILFILSRIRIICSAAIWISVACPCAPPRG